MLDIVLFRNDPEKVREAQRRRFRDEGVVDEVLQLDDQWRQGRFRVDSLRKELNALSKEIGRLKKSGADASELVPRTGEVKTEISGAENDIESLERRRDERLRSIANLVHDSVRVAEDEDDNELIREWGGRAEAGLPGRNHVDLLYMIDGVDYDRGAAVAGSRGYFLKGVGVRLNLALISYGTDFLLKRHYTPLQPPYFMEKHAMSKVAQLEQFDEELYTVGGKNAGEKYLIATSEQPIAAYHLDDWVQPGALPLRYVGLSTCFRKEAGSHGKDTLGIFRVHQFEKLEQFVLTSPDDNKSWEMHEEMLQVAEEFHHSLGLPYRVVSIVSKALNNSAAKKYDIEGWYPAGGAYRELVSCSNCTDYQARRLGTRYGHKKAGEREKKYVHMLNSTLCATTRVICAILENYQSPEGVVVPEVLRPYMGGTTMMKFVNDPPKLKAAAAAAATNAASGAAQQQK